MRVIIHAVGFLGEGINLSKHCLQGALNRTGAVVESVGCTLLVADPHLCSSYVVLS